MKIELKLPLETLRVFSTAIDDIYNAKPTVNKMEKVYRSIGFDLAENIAKRYKAAKKKYGNLFDNDKKVNISFKFHEAWALIEILRELVASCPGDYEKNHLQGIIAVLDKKTA